MIAFRLTYLNTRSKEKGTDFFADKAGHQLIATTGQCHPAQGWNGASTLGQQFKMIFNPNRNLCKTSVAAPRQRAASVISLENMAATILIASEGGILPPVPGQNAAGSRLHWPARKPASTFQTCSWSFFKKCVAADVSRRKLNKGKQYGANSCSRLRGASQF
jgi:hypothetical protein